MAIQTQRTMTVAEYLDWEERQECKHEYIDGEIIEMTDGTLKHTRIKTNIGGTLFALLDFSTYILCNSDMRLRVGQTRYVYPDFSVVHGEPRMEDDKELTLLNPCVRSRGDLAVKLPMYDRVDKLDYYSDVPSIEAYLIVDQDRIRADLYTRTDEGWHVRVFNSLDDVIALESLDCELPLAQVYQGIAFEKA